MYETPVYLYTQRQEVVLLSGGSPRSYVKVYSKELTIIKGVDNELQFQVLNQEQKPVNIDGKQITARIISYDGKTTLLQKTLLPIFALTGITSLQVTAAELAGIDAQKAYYSLEIPGGSMYASSILLTATGSGYIQPPSVSIVGGGGTGATATATIANGQITGITITNGGRGYTSGPRVVFSPPPAGGTLPQATVSLTGSEYAVFVDAQGGGRGVLNIVNSTLPSFVQSQPVTIPSHPWPPGANANGVIYTSSTVNTVEQPTFTLQTTYANFTGNTNIEGSVVTDFSLPYPITQPVSYTDYTGTVGISVAGYHPFIRLSIQNMGTEGVLPTNANLANLSGTTYYGGDITDILFR
jgi:hypothetical protein